jgi:hypothetical protein
MTDESNHNEFPGGESSDQAGGETSGGKNQVSYDTYRKTVDESKALKKQLKELTERLSVFDNEKRTNEERLKLEQNKHVEVIGDLKKQIEELNGRYQQSEGRFKEYRTVNAAFGILHQKGVQLDPKYAHLLDLNDVAVDENGNIDSAALSKAVDSFMKEHPVLVQPKRADLPGGKTGGSGPTLTYEEWTKLPLKEKQARYKDIKQ